MEIGLKLLAKTNSKEINESILRQLAGSVIYLVASRIDLSYVVSLISRFMTTSNVIIWTIVKRVLRYVKETLEYRRSK